MLQLFTNSYGHFCFAELEREREGNVDCVNNTFTSFYIYGGPKSSILQFYALKLLIKTLFFMKFLEDVYCSIEYMYSDV